jgi:hypothetical protein
MREIAFDVATTPTRTTKMGRLRACRRADRSVAELASLITSPKVTAMLDFVMIALGVGFFVASVLYVLACERM